MCKNSFGGCNSAFDTSHKVGVYVVEGSLSSLLLRAWIGDAQAVVRLVHDKVSNIIEEQIGRVAATVVLLLAVQRQDDASTLVIIDKELLFAELLVQTAHSTMLANLAK